MADIDVMAIDLDKVPPGALKQLIQEVRDEDYEAVRAYDRVHNRHNRGKGGRIWPSEETDQ